jgi:hypothetical protein
MFGYSGNKTRAKPPNPELYSKEVTWGVIREATLKERVSLQLLLIL